jgi:hypothetical protein
MGKEDIARKKELTRRSRISKPKRNKNLTSRKKTVGVVKKVEQYGRKDNKQNGKNMCNLAVLDFAYNATAANPIDKCLYRK